MEEWKAENETGVRGTAGRQVKKRSGIMRWIIPICVIIIIAGIFIYKKNRGREISAQELPPARGTIAIEFRETGSVQPRNELNISSQVSGRIEDILVVEGQRVKKGDVMVWMSSTDRAALLDAARTQGEAEMKKWEDVYNPTPIVAPVDGFITARLKEPGQSSSLADVILVMADKLIIEAYVDETDLRYMYLGQKVKTFLDAYPDQEFRGTVEHIAYRSETENNVTVYLVKILPDKVPAVFRSGMTATVEVVGETKKDVLKVPLDAITEKNGKKTVKVKSADGKPEDREVVTGINNGKEVEIVSGITENDKLLMPELIKKASNMHFRGMPGMGGGGRR